MTAFEANHLTNIRDYIMIVIPGECTDISDNTSLCWKRYVDETLLPSNTAIQVNSFLYILTNVTLIYFNKYHHNNKLLLTVKTIQWIYTKQNSFMSRKY